MTLTVVKTGDWYNQKINRIYHDMAEHYNTAIIPARPKKPRDYPQIYVIFKNSTDGLMAGQ